MAGDEVKTPVAGMVERRGARRCFGCARGRERHLAGYGERIFPSSTIFTDELHGYDGIPNMKVGATSIAALSTAQRFMSLAVSIPTLLKGFGV
jgi:hypothetical protein